MRVVAVIEALSEGQARVEGFRHELGKVRHALDNTDSVLAVADESLQIAEEVIDEARRVLPAIVMATAVIAVAAIGVYLWRKRDKDQDS